MPNQNNLLNGTIEQDEYGEFYAGYISYSRGENLFERLDEGQKQIQNLVSQLDDTKAGFRYEKEKWSIKEILGHLADTERVMNYRALCFARGDSGELPGFNQDHYVEHSNFDEWPLEKLMKNYETVRVSTLTLFESFTDKMLLRRGIASEQPFSVRALGFVIAGHEMHHLAILRETYLPKINS